jgi:hypothetical protein
LPWGACCRRLHDSQLKVFCFFSSEKKTFFFLVLMLVTAPLAGLQRGWHEPPKKESTTNA